MNGTNGMQGMPGMQGMNGMNGMQGMPYYPGTYSGGAQGLQGMNGGNGTSMQGVQGMQVPYMSNGGGMNGGMLPTEQSYIENILRLNRGKEGTVYMTFENNDEWNAKVFRGIIEAAGRDHIILSDPQNGKRYILLMIYLDYITFDEEINYSYPFNGSPMAQYPPRR
ncbi:spore coat protein GerQ [Halobacillus sp. Marseille-Q1614]|uniref:spore coat protein GerQ n=1 Tax=Halobacillus sp. Marseille-Q1614 TaxID=2709134 RepID=UPI00352FF766